MGDGEDDKGMREGEGVLELGRRGGNGDTTAADRLGKTITQIIKESTAAALPMRTTALPFCRQGNSDTPTHEHDSLAAF